MQSEGSDILKTDGTTAESLKGAPEDHRPCADGVCSPTERKRVLPSFTQQAFPSEVTLPYRLGPERGKGLPRSHSKPGAKGSQTPMLWCPLTNPLTLVVSPMRARAGLPCLPATCPGPRTGSGTNICQRDVWRWVDVISKPGPTQTVKLQALISGQRDSGSSYLCAEHQWPLRPAMPSVR